MCDKSASGAVCKGIAVCDILLAPYIWISAHGMQTFSLDFCGFNIFLKKNNKTHGVWIWAVASGLILGWWSWHCIKLHPSVLVVWWHGLFFVWVFFCLVGAFCLFLCVCCSFFFFLSLYILTNDLRNFSTSFPTCVPRGSSEAADDHKLYTCADSHSLNVSLVH